MKALLATATFFIPILITVLMMIRRQRKETALRAAANARAQEQLRWRYGEKSTCGRRRHDERQWGTREKK